MTRKQHSKGFIGFNAPGKRTRPTRFPKPFMIGFAVIAALFLVMSTELLGKTDGKAVPDFSVETLDGKFTLSEQNGKTLIYFFSFPG